MMINLDWDMLDEGMTGAVGMVFYELERMAILLRWIQDLHDNF